jgi:hypothetical protein
VYIAVLGTSLIVALLGISALVVQRVQNRMITASADIRQAQLNAVAAVELGLLAIKQNAGWRTTYADLEQPWFTRSTGAGTASLTAGPADATADEAANDLLFADPDAPVTLVGIGRVQVGERAEAEQRFALTLDPRREPTDLLRAAAETAKIGLPLTGQAAALDWSALASEYQVLGTQLDVNSLPTTTALFSRNRSLNDGETHWTRNLPDGLSGYLDGDNIDVNGGPGNSRTACLEVERDNPNSWQKGAANRLNSAVLKPNTVYQVSLDIHASLLPGIPPFVQETRFRISLIVEFQNGTTALSPDKIVHPLSGNGSGGSWTTISGTLTTPNWTEQPTAVYLVINSDDSVGIHKDFYVDNLDFYESGPRFIHQKVLGPGVNPFGTADPDGIYWINCAGNTLVLERSRILGTLLVLNPGPNSRIAHGPIHLSPFLPGYPALIVDGNFAIQATNRPLGEAENSSAEYSITTNYNSTGMPYEFGTSTVGSEDGNANDNYPSEIRGLVAISGNLTYANLTLIRGPVIVGGNTVSGGGTLSVEHSAESLITPPPGFIGPYVYDRRPASGSKAVVP